MASFETPSITMTWALSLLLNHNQALKLVQEELDTHALSDCHVAGYHVPKGTCLIVNLWKLHRDPKIWANPNEFQPKRFLSENVKMDVKGQCFEYLPYKRSKNVSRVTLSLQMMHLVLGACLSILSAEFIRTSIHGVGNMEAVILSKIKARASLPKNGEDNEEKLPFLLRIYRDTLTAHMKTAIKTAVTDILPILLTQSLESDYAPGERMVDADGGSSLASKLRSLSSESFVQLLEAIFSIVQVMRI
ncbi:hypothetical protein LOK49_LG09G02555 [Camellia lanceoleosa]|uniref:Uncharacterized protein n=1 Tax=Camellia lanceoleosa TaxID=1840588 RepID=A0ACC0GJZ7_9ERIC|nr:hypothetical protein LOK49_LG09G02555 [Camellia lanceoleosa]